MTWKSGKYRGNDVLLSTHRDPLTGNVVLSAKPLSWTDFFALADQMVPADFMSDRADPAAEERDAL